MKNKKQNPKQIDIKSGVEDSPISETTSDKRQTTNVKLPKVISFNPGDKVKLKTRTKTWEGHALESHDPEIILLKLESGYNIGIRENEILNAKIILPAKRSTSEAVHQRSGLSAKRSVSEAVCQPKAVCQRSGPSAEGGLPAEDYLQKLPKVVFVITGGTISARLDPKTGGAISTDKETILNIAPQIKEICNPILNNPFMKASEDMSFPDWKKLAEICETHLNNPEIKGIIITHGTDTLHYTASALSFFIKNPNKPIALTYSQRSIDRASTDAALNLICATKYATSDIAEIALIGHKDTNDNICLAMPATKVRKMHTSRRDAFKIINSEPIAEITPEKITILKTFNARSNSKPKLDTKFSDKVALIQIYPGQNPAILDYYQQQGYKGIILETTGLGHVPGKASEFNWLPKIKKAIDGGIIICATPQTIYGRLNPNVYSAGRDLQKTGIIFLENMLPETALIKLSWVLGHKTWDPKQKMLENISNEINK